MTKRLLHAGQKLLYAGLAAGMLALPLNAKEDQIKSEKTVKSEKAIEKPEVHIYYFPLRKYEEIEDLHEKIKIEGILIEGAAFGPLEKTLLDHQNMIQNFKKVKNKIRYTHSTSLLPKIEEELDNILKDPETQKTILQLEGKTLASDYKMKDQIHAHLFTKLRYSYNRVQSAEAYIVNKKGNKVMSSKNTFQYSTLKHMPIPKLFEQYWSLNSFKNDKGIIDAKTYLKQEFVKGNESLTEALERIKDFKFRLVNDWLLSNHNFPYLKY